MTARPAPRRLTLVAALTVLCATWGSTWLVIKTGLQTLPVLSSAAARFTIAAAVFGLIAPWLHRHEGGKRPPGWLALVMGSFNFAIPYGIVYIGETVIPSGLASVLWAVFPMFTAGLGHWVLPGERLQARQWSGFILGLTGVAMLFVTDLREIGAHAVAMGGLFVFSPLAAAIGQVVTKRHGREFSSALLNRNAMTIGAVLLWAVALSTEQPTDAVLTPAAIGSVLYLAICGTVVTFGLYFWLLRHIGANRLSLIAYVTPAVALWLGWAVGNEPLTASTLGGSALILVGIFVALRGGSQPQHAPTAESQG